jgi:hypothetical protein
MARPTRVTTRDLRALLHLAGELNELPDDRDGRVRHALRRMGELLHTPVASMQQSRGFRPDRREFPTVWGVVEGDAAARESFTRFAFEARNSGETVAFLATHPGRAAVRSDVLADRAWFRSRVFNEYIRPAGIDMGVAGSYVLPGSNDVIGFSWNPVLRDRRFGARERAIVQIFNDEFGWFFKRIASGPEPDRLSLPRYLQRTLDRLMAGDSEKQAAVRLGLSRHTVHDYIKALHRRFGVASRAELLLKVMAIRRPFGSGFHGEDIAHAATPKFTAGLDSR